jgi:hypothetical protein
MGADIAINAAKQEAKYFLVLGDPVLVSGFIVICGGWLFSGPRRGLNRTDYRQKMGMIDLGNHLVGLAGREDEGGGDADSDATQGFWVVDAPDQVIDNFSHQGGKIDVERRGQVVQIVVNDWIQVAQNRLKIPVRFKAGEAHRTEERPAKVIDRHVNSRRAR